MVLLPPAGTTWQTHTAASVPPAPPGQGDTHPEPPTPEPPPRAPSPAPTHHLLGADGEQLVRGHPLASLQGDRDDFLGGAGTGTALSLWSRSR